ncbi:MAG: hypothetical protein CMJ59_12490 [Planctomycetaceae bacterium]|nr:hypothetical protein [Planctomycetaceae bacterium]
MLPRIILTLLPLLMLGGPSTARAQIDAVVHFEQRVRPVLLANCIPCHGSKKQESGLRLDSRAFALVGGEQLGPALVLTSPAESPLLRAVRHQGDIRMPPRRQLDPRVIRDLEQWLRAGAPWPTDSDVAIRPAPADAWKTHWAAQPIRPPVMPDIDPKQTPNTPIDAFVAHRLAERGLRWSAVASPRTLIRRAHFVLTGLPPEPTEVEQFRRDYTAAPRRAMQQLVDHLLDTPQYGERWARHWLDLARYADTKGYVRLQEQPNYYYAYTYRDYVIRAFNQDLPYDRFIREQLAADQLIGESADNRALAALGFLTLGRRFTGNQHDVIDDRIDVVTRTVLGLTVTCARCHDHKFDPIATADYYALYGVFSSTTEPSDLPSIGRTRKRPTFLGEQAAYRAKRAALDAQIARYLPPTLDMLRADTTRYLQGVLAGRQKFLVPLPAAVGELRQTFVERWVEYLEGTKRGTHSVFAAWHALRDLPHDGFPSRATQVLARLSTDGGQPPGDRLPINSRVLAALTARPLTSMQDVATRYGNVLRAVHLQWKAARTDDPQLAELEDPTDEDIRQVLYGADSPFSLSPRDALDAYLLDANWNRDLSQAYLDFDAWLVGSGHAPDRAHALYDSRRIHEPHIFIRGNPQRVGRRVRRAAPRLLGEALSRPFLHGSGRLELAESLVNHQNPLTARVIANRLWRHHFGHGLVPTPSNFGLRAAAPSHPALLDYLAHDLMAHDWSLKHLHRTILLSRTWQQASRDRPLSRQADPENRLLWRYNRRRLDTETLRDALLAVAGRLDLQMGGPPASLLQPDNVRRTIYGHLDRSGLPTILRLFDFPSPDTHSPTRSRTTAPQQALYLLNSPFVIAQARSLAQRALQRGGGSNAATFRDLYRLTLARRPSPDEWERGQRYLGQSGQRWNELAQALLISNEFLFID